jgi:hypothetical protein
MCDSRTSVLCVHYRLNLPPFRIQSTKMTYPTIHVSRCTLHGTLVAENGTVLSCELTSLPFPRLQ